MAGSMSHCWSNLAWAAEQGGTGGTCTPTFSGRGVQEGTGTMPALCEHDDRCQEQVEQPRSVRAAAERV